MSYNNNNFHVTIYIINVPKCGCGFFGTPCIFLNACFISSSCGILQIKLSSFLGDFSNISFMKRDITEIRTNRTSCINSVNSWIMDCTIADYLSSPLPRAKSQH